MTAAKSGTERIYYLSQQSPMLHFQYSDPEATLRATELKPKLDHFIEKWMEHVDRELPSEWRMKKDSDKKSNEDEDTAKSAALNYRIRILNLEGNMTSEPDRNMPFFGNMGDDTEKKACIKSNGCIEVHIRCYIKDLMSIIDDCLPTFFLTVNFGTRQNKGFGSFVLCNEAGKALFKRQENEQFLIQWFGKNKVYCIKYRQQTSDLEKLSDINTIYQLLKSGINSNGIYLKSYLRDCFAEKNIDWDKKALKSHSIAPVVYSSPKHAPTPLGPNERFVRGLFGVGDQQQWFSDDGFHNKKIKGYNKRTGKPIYERETISVKAKSRNIERVPSPLTFKIIGNSVYMFIEEINSSLPGSWFTFKNESGNTIDLQIPSSSEYNFNEIMDGFKDRVNSPGVRDVFAKRPKEQRPIFIQQNCTMEVLGEE